MNSKILLILILTQLGLIVFLSYQIYKKQKNSLGVSSLNPINKKTIDFKPSKELKYFYEPSPNIIEKVNEWFPYKGAYTINSDSLNERFDYSVEKPQDTYRIITLGDSFTYGLYVNTKDNWSEKLEDMLNNQLKCSNIKKFEVINLGVHGYDTQYEVERFIRRGTKYSPDLVIWFFVDLKRLNEKLRPLDFYYYNQLNKTGEFKRLIKKGIYYRSWSLAYQQVIKELGKDKIYEYQNRQLEEFNKIYKGPLLALATSWIISQPKEYNLLNNFSTIRPNTYFLKKSIQYSEFPNDHHPNKQGHRTIAQTVFNYLSQNKIINCIE